MQVFLDDQIFHRQKIGGVSRYNCNLAEALARTNKIKVTLFGGWSQNAFLRNLIPHHNLRIVHLPRRDKLKIRRLAMGLSSLWRRRAFEQALKWDSNIIYHPTYFQPDDSLHEKACATVATFQDMIPEITANMSQQQERYRANKLKTARKAHRLIAASQSTKKDMHQYYPFIKERIDVVYHGSSLSYFEDCLSRSAPNHPQPYFVFVGKRRGYKNGLAAIHAFGLLAEAFPEVHLVFCGGEVGPGSEERSLIEGHRIDGRVDYVSADDFTLKKLLHGAIALVYPSLYEGFGLPVLEAMQHGCPVITTRLGSLPEVAGRAGIYIDPHSPEDIAIAMRRMLTQSDERKNFIDRGLHQAQKFSLAKTAENTLAVYRKALESTRRCTFI